MSGCSIGISFLVLTLKGDRSSVQAGVQEAMKLMKHGVLSTVARNLGTNVNGMERNWRKMRETSWEKIYQGCGTRTRERETCRLVGKPGIYNVKFSNRFLISKLDFLKTLKSLGIGNLLKHFSFTRSPAPVVNCLPNKKKVGAGH